MDAERILLVEDDERIGASLLRALTGSGYQVSWRRSGAEAEDEVRQVRPDLVLLDLGLPDVDGLEVCRTLRSLVPHLPVLMLTARDEEMDVVVGLDAGASDYVTKPFKLAELLARIRAQLRTVPAGAPGRPEDAGRSVAGDITIDVAARRVWREAVELDLRPKEFDLLARLMQEAGSVVRRETLMAEVWDENWFGSTKTLDFHVAALRRKLDRTEGQSHITTLRGVGFRFEAP